MLFLSIHALHCFRTSSFAGPPWFLGYGPGPLTCGETRIICGEVLAALSLTCPLLVVLHTGSCGGVVLKGET